MDKIEAKKAYESYCKDNGFVIDSVESKAQWSEPHYFSDGGKTKPKIIRITIITEYKLK